MTFNHSHPNALICPDVRQLRNHRVQTDVFCLAEAVVFFVSWLLVGKAFSGE